jgi:hypothetical protein
VYSNQSSTNSRTNRGFQTKFSPKAASLGSKDPALENLDFVSSKSRSVEAGICLLLYAQYIP